MGMGETVNPHNLRHSISEGRQKLMKELREWVEEEPTDYEDYLNKQERNTQNAKKYFKRRNGFER